MRRHDCYKQMNFPNLVPGLWNNRLSLYHTLPFCAKFCRDYYKRKKTLDLAQWTYRNRPWRYRPFPCCPNKWRDCNKQPNILDSIRWPYCNQPWPYCNLSLHSTHCHDYYSQLKIQGLALYSWNNR